MTSQADTPLTQALATYGHLPLDEVTYHGQGSHAGTPGVHLTITDCDAYTSAVTLSGTTVGPGVHTAPGTYTLTGPDGVHLTHMCAGPTQHTSPAHAGQVAS